MDFEKRTENIYSVSKINNYIKRLIDTEGIFHNVKIEGEIGTLNEWKYGIIYFVLKDDESNIQCSYNPNYARKINFKLEKGMKVVLRGDVEVNTKRGEYSFKAVEITKKEEIGHSLEELLKLKAELEALGMFDPAYKRPIPIDCKTIGVVTSETGAVINDIINVTKSRNPYTKIVLAPSTVSTDKAIPSIVNGIKALEKYPVDVIIVGRGGGSDEDLWVYNSREVAEAVFDCSVPVISAVGHDINYSILDLVVDKRAATPSQAAEFAVFDLKTRIDKLKNYENNLKALMNSKIKLQRATLMLKATALKAKNPRKILENRKANLESYNERLRNDMNKVLTKKRHELELYIEKFKGLSPLDKLNQGYAYVSYEGRTLNSIESVKTGDTIEVFVKDGCVSAAVTKTDKLNYD